MIAQAQNKIDLRPDTGIAAAAMAAFSGLALVTGLQLANPIVASAGMLGTAATAGYWSKKKVGIQDLQAGAIELAQSFETVVDDLTDSAKKSTTAVMGYVPPEYKPYLDRFMEKAQDTSWIQKFLERSGMVVGASGSGKTVYELFEVHQFLLHNPTGRILIGDINYGKPTIGNEPNTWFNLPKGRVLRIHPVEVFEGIEETWNELQRRKAICIARADEKRETELAGREYKQPEEFAPWLMLVDEGLATLDALDRLEHPTDPKRSLKDLAMDYCSDLLFEGRAYNVRFKIVVQSLLVTETGFGRGKMQQMNFLVLGKSAIDVEVLSRVPSIGHSAASDWADRVNEMRQKDKYVCLVRMDGGDPEVAVKVLPTIDLSELKVEIPIDLEALPEHERWLNEVLESQCEEFRFWLSEWVSGEIKSPWLQILKSAGIHHARDRNPEKFDALKSWVKSTVDEIKGGQS